MKILLMGEYSNVHWTLAEGLRTLGHDVTVVSDGDRWKNYPRDINLQRHGFSLLPSLRYVLEARRVVGSLKGFDVVQLINPVFLDLKPERILPFYKTLRRNNGRLFLGAFGMDYYYVKASMDCKTFRYSDFNFGDAIRHYPFADECVTDWLKGEKGGLNRFVAEDCDGIVSGLYEYDVSYRPYFPSKLRFIPFPINPDDAEPVKEHDGPVRFFIGIQRSRSEYKGTDIMLRALEKVKHDYPRQCEVVKVENVPFAEYERLLNGSDVLLDQLYSYTPAMNALMAMAKGLIVVGGAEPENYEILNESELRPIINVAPTEQDVYTQLVSLITHPERLPELKRQSLEYIRRHHDYRKVAQRYLDFWQRK